MHHNQPSNMDDLPMARQKRKRTSPERQRLSEATYNRDRLPDKAARLKMVKAIALGDKEVQIWFQNRRQSPRRKSRPLLPQEISQSLMTRDSNETQQQRVWAPKDWPSIGAASTSKGRMTSAWSPSGSQVVYCHE
ncbi:uncharacterized protein MYCGRDRAFT_106635 [Zymoseptoria tritici IPO323]|uniref:Homeobox domain-containing protein n=1 Tax=Zymoseptoria tritici (strain CBS 115943 / IPO323) TaxID=336722 RepID=F9XRA8_ZYMTI|nr:uncharacterized protein MYCGRDRAFT_106635 [Zymoseptoria tritici IPO323]EGP82241.1 hypothetical protein MYCGRDRAFT_106635 [Zymoseptoria tritici IPO323]